jgi:predicted acyltransferase
MPLFKKMGIAGALSLQDPLLLDTAGSERLLSIDVFRGGTIAAMLLVDGQGGSETFAGLKHSEWHGLTFADSIAPCFMWIVGLSLYISINKRLAKGDGKAALLRNVLRRSVLLFLIGVLLNFWMSAVTVIVNFNVQALDLPQVMGTLQRIALGYLVAGVVIVVVDDPRKHALFAFLVLVGYTTIFFFFPAPDFSPGDLTREGNAAGFIDRLIFGDYSNLSHPLLSCLSAAAMVLVGSLFGRALIREKRRELNLAKLICVGTAFVAGSLLLVGSIPMNFRLWTISYVLATGGGACLSFGLVYGLLEILRVFRGIEFLRVLGMNPIVIWVLDDAVRKSLSAKGLVNQDNEWINLWELLFDKISIPAAPPEFNSSLMAIGFGIILYFMARFLYSRKIFIRI